MSSSSAQTSPIEPPNGDSTAPAPLTLDSRNRTSQSLMALSDPSNTRRCFVCLVDEPEDALPANWSTPCTCTLEGHHECLMAWITDLEAQGKDVKCPICKSPITVLEPWDLAIHLDKVINNQLSRWTPRVLLGFIASGIVVSSSAYGLKALDWFAGREATINYLLNSEKRTLFDLVTRPPRTMNRYNEPQVNLFHVALLPLIAPGLVFNRIEFVDVVSLPLSLLYATVIDQVDESFIWPPSPHRALALYPSIRAAYFTLYRSISTKLEKKWAAKAKKQVPNPSLITGATGPEHPDPEPEQHILNIEFELGLNLGDEGDAGRNRRNNRAPNGRSVFSFVAGALLWPGVCCGMGELMRLVLPSRLVTRPASGPNTGILQERWGRSLVGGCLFVVLKDAFFLWVKYRRMMNSSFRRVKNVNNRNLRR